MLAEADDIPLYERRIDFQESLHRDTVVGEEAPVFQESSNDEEEEEEAAEETSTDDATIPPTE